MPPVPESKLTEIKAAVPCVRYIESVGLTVQQSGNDFLCSCPLDGHEDKNPSFRMTGPLYNCLSRCGGGNVFQLVQKIENCDFLAAVEKLAALGGVAFEITKYRTAGNRQAAPASCPISENLSDGELSSQVIDFYHSQLLQRGNAGWEYLKKRGLDCTDLAARFRLGFAKRGELGKRIPNKLRHAGKELRRQLENIGFFKGGSGHEYFSGSLVIPVFNSSNVLLECYGRKTIDHLRAGTPKHIYLPKDARPQESRGVWNFDGIQQSADKSLILCESLIDALTCVKNGYRHSTCAYGTSGFQSDMLAAYEAAQIQDIFIAYDNDDSGNAAAEKVAEQCIHAGMTVYRVQVPAALNDVNAYCVDAGQESEQALFDLVAGATWIGGKPFVVIDDLDAGKDQETAENASPPKTQEKRKSTLKIVQEGADLFCGIGSRAYRIRHFAKNTVAGVLKIQLRVSVNDDDFQENIELCSNKTRRQFCKQACTELGIKEDVFHGDLKKLLRVLEDRQDEYIAAVAAKNDTGNSVPDMSAEERAEALAALKNPDLIAHIGGDLEKAGLIGEEISRLVCYIAATSRLLPDPLGMVIQSSSSAGKSSVMNAILKLMPDEAQKHFSAMSKQSLLYLAHDALEHKILGVAELAGAKDICYNLKMLLSEKYLSMASVSQDPITGDMQTREYRVNGPAALMLTTTEEDDEIDSELLNRCLVVSVTETKEQTEAILQRQRYSDTFAGLNIADESEAIAQRHQNMQRLLKPVRVVNNYAPQLTFIANEPRHRRDHKKYLTLIKSIALLHQYQRDIKKHPRGYEYIEVIPDDIAVANHIAAVVLGRSLDQLTPKTRELLRLIDSFVAATAERESIARDAVTFTRRTLRESLSWGDTSLFRHMQRLSQLEFLSTARETTGTATRYALHYTHVKNSSGVVLNLLDAAQLVNPLTYDAEHCGLRDQHLPLIHPAFTPDSPPIHPNENEQTPTKQTAKHTNGVSTLKTHIRAQFKKDNSASKTPEVISDATA